MKDVPDASSYMCPKLLIPATVKLGVPAYSTVLKTPFCVADSRTATQRVAVISRKQFDSHREEYRGAIQTRKDATPL